MCGTQRYTPTRLPTSPYRTAAAIDFVKPWYEDVASESVSMATTVWPGSRHLVNQVLVKHVRYQVSGFSRVSQYVKNQIFLFASMSRPTDMIAFGCPVYTFPRSVANAKLTIADIFRTKYSL